MGRVRVCGAACHGAREPKCVCWCNGMMHGPGGAEVREAFEEAFGERFTDPEQKPIAGTERLRVALEHRAEELGSLHVREPYHRWVF